MLATVDQAVGANLRALRDSAGISQGDLAARMTVLGTDWTASNVSLIEAGKRKLTLTALGDLCRILGVPVLALLGTEHVEGVTAERLAALGGSRSATTGAQPDVADDEQAAEVAQRRLGDRIVTRIIAGVRWDEMEGAPDDRRAAVMDAIEEEYGSRDVWQVREELAADRAHSSRASSLAPTLDDVADARAWATRRIIEKVSDVMYELYPFVPPF